MRSLLVLLAFLVASVYGGIPYHLDINHPWPDSTLWGGFMLVVTNFILAPSIYLFIRWNRFDVAGVLFLMCIISSAYHICRAGFECQMKYRNSQVADHLCVYISLLWIVSYGIVRKEWFPIHVSSEYILRIQAGIFFMMFIPILGLVLENPESIWVQVFGFVMPAVIVIVSAAITGTRLFYRRLYGWIGVVLFSAGAVFYAMCPVQYYDWAHSLWHVLSMLAVPFVQVGFDEHLWKK